MLLNFEYGTVSVVSYLSSDKTRTCEMDKSSVLFLYFFGSGLRGSKAYSLWDGVIPNPSIGYDYL